MHGFLMWGICGENNGKMGKGMDVVLPWALAEACRPAQGQHLWLLLLGDRKPFKNELESGPLQL